MKTITSTFGIKGLVISAAIASSLTLGVLAQPSPERNSTESKYFKQLENFINSNEKKLKYTAPDEATEEKQVNEAIQRLDEFSSLIDADLKYNAPVEMEDQSIQNLEELADITLAQLKYTAPLESEEISPESDEPLLSATELNATPAKIELPMPTLQESWLINAGYFKSSGKQNRF